MLKRSTNVRFLHDPGYLAAMNALYTAKAWSAHLLRGKLPRSIHSPYLFSLFTECYREKQTTRRWESIEEQRDQLLKRNDRIERMDFGAGSIRGQNTRQQPVRHIARNALSRRSQCRFMARLGAFIKAGNILELGTSLGIMSAYLKSGSPGATITTVEGDPAIAAIAREIWNALHLDIHGVHATFESFFESPSFQQAAYDLVFIDGNHRSAALLNYAQILLPHLHPDSILVVDDIYWSKDMQQGWRELCQWPVVTQSVDCFHFGLLFFSPGFLAKEHHRIILL